MGSCGMGCEMAGGVREPMLRELRCKLSVMVAEVAENEACACTGVSPGCKRSGSLAERRVRGTKWDKE